MTVRAGDGDAVGVEWVEVEMDIGSAHAARVHDYLLGGPHHFAVDREAAERYAAALPGGVDRARRMVRTQRSFLRQAVQYMASEAGLRQFLDIGTGIPNDDEVHAVAQQTARDSRVVYVDNDPVVLAKAHVLLQSTPRGASDFIPADLRDLDTILARASTTLDLTRPVGVLLVGTLHVIPDTDDPYKLVGRLMDALPAGSHLAMSHFASDVLPELVEAMRRANETMRDAYVLRSRDEVARLLDGLELLEPGIVAPDRWHSPTERAPTSEGPPVAAYCALARKP